jgi:hypothetical protein
VSKGGQGDVLFEPNGLRQFDKLGLALSRQPWIRHVACLKANVFIGGKKICRIKK